MTDNHLVWDTSILRWWVASNATLLKVSFKDLCFSASCFKCQTRIKRERVNGKFTWSFCYFGNCSTPSSFGGKAVNMIVIRKLMMKITRIKRIRTNVDYVPPKLSWPTPGWGWFCTWTSRRWTACTCQRGGPAFQPDQSMFSKVDADYFMTKNRYRVGMMSNCHW